MRHPNLLLRRASENSENLIIVIIRNKCELIFLLCLILAGRKCVYRGAYLSTEASQAHERYEGEITFVLLTVGSLACNRNLFVGDAGKPSLPLDFNAFSPGLLLGKQCTHQKAFTLREI